MYTVQNKNVLSHKNVDIEIITWHEYADHESKNSTKLTKFVYLTIAIYTHLQIMNGSVIPYNRE